LIFSATAGIRISPFTSPAPVPGWGRLFELALALVDC
jgi:hypothetical protein